MAESLQMAFFFDTLLYCGIHKECPLSPFIYNLVLEHLASPIRQSQDIKVVGDIQYWIQIVFMCQGLFWKLLSVVTEAYWNCTAI